MKTTTTEASAFFYIDGIPTKGCWVDLDSSTTWANIGDAIREAIPTANPDEILCADAEGLALHFLSRFDGFDLTGWQEWSEAAEKAHLEPEIIATYCDNVGSWDADAVSQAEDCYMGTFANDTEFAEEYSDSTGMLDSIPEHLRYYFDFQAFARDLLAGDFFESDGHYFHSR